MPVALFKKQFEALIFNQHAYIAKYILHKGTLDHFLPLFFVRHVHKTRWIMLESNSPKELPKELILVLLVVGLDICFGGLDGFETGRFRLHFVLFPEFFELANCLNLVFCNEIAEFQKLLE